MIKTELGTKGEDIACKYLANQGYIIQKRNFKCKSGEIDIIAKEKNEIVFIEVKTRTSKKYGNPSEAVTETKQKHIKKATEFYIYKHNLENNFIRFDVIEVYLKGKIFCINHIKNILW